MGLRVYNTLSRKKEDFETGLGGIASMYVCGPTADDNAHVGHGMSSLVFDIIRRYLQYRGYEVRHVMNYTDVDDKIIQRAIFEEGDVVERTEEICGRTRVYLKDLNVLPAMIYPRV